LGIPEDEIDNFNTAIEDGRAVVVYPNAGADEPAVAAAFKAAGLRNVRAY
jgi:rhodanese-related sulfurtransferase